MLQRLGTTPTIQIVAVEYRHMRRTVRKRSLRRKNLILDQRKIDRAKKILGARTETEAITRALDAVSDLASFRAELDAGMRVLVGRGGFEDRFAFAR
jgi:hypothetical protein